jgi:hypothetical protein
LCAELASFVLRRVKGEFIAAYGKRRQRRSQGLLIFTAPVDFHCIFSAAFLCCNTLVFRFNSGNCRQDTKMNAKTTVVLMLLLAATAAQGEVKEIFFRNKKDNTAKVCRKIEGKVKTIISCDDKPFTPSADWEEINAEKVCFQHDDGRIRACDELSRQGSSKKSHICFDLDKKLVPFTPGKEWKRLAGKDTICTEEHKRFDVPRNMTMPSLNLE